MRLASQREHCVPRVPPERQELRVQPPEGRHREGQEGQGRNPSKNGKGKGKGKDKDKGKKGKGKGKGKICLFFNDKGCNHGGACKMLREAPAMAARGDQTQANLAPKAKAAAAPQAAAVDSSKP